MKKILTGMFLIFVVYACKKETPPVEEEVPAPVATSGDLKGRVNQYDQYGDLYTSGLNTTTVSIDSIGTSCVTDEKGKYLFKSVSSGTYTLLFKKPGCGLIKKIGIDFKFTDSSTYNAELADLPSFGISNAYLKDTSWFSTPLAGIYYNAAVSPFNSQSKFVAILGKSPSMSLADPLSYIQFSLPTSVGTTDYARFISYDFLKQSYGFKKDSMIYVKIYPVATKGASYYNNAIKKPVFTAFGVPFQVLSIKMPQ